jgi:hypothetical protein
MHTRPPTNATKLSSRRERPVLWILLVTLGRCNLSPIPIHALRNKYIVRTKRSSKKVKNEALMLPLRDFLRFTSRLVKFYLTLQSNSRTSPPASRTSSPRCLLSLLLFVFALILVHLPLPLSLSIPSLPTTTTPPQFPLQSPRNLSTNPRMLILPHAPIPIPFPPLFQIPIDNASAYAPPARARADEVPGAWFESWIGRVCIVVLR